MWPVNWTVQVDMCLIPVNSGKSSTTFTRMMWVMSVCCWLAKKITSSYWSMLIFTLNSIFISANASSLLFNKINLMWTAVFRHLFFWLYASLLIAIYVALSMLLFDIVYFFYSVILFVVANYMLLVASSGLRIYDNYFFIIQWLWDSRIYLLIIS
jgi:hypothetical protein